MIKQAVKSASLGFNNIRKELLASMMEIRKSQLKLVLLLFKALDNNHC